MFRLIFGAALLLVAFGVSHFIFERRLVAEGPERGSPSVSGPAAAVAGADVTPDAPDSVSGNLDADRLHVHSPVVLRADRIILPQRLDELGSDYEREAFDEMELPLFDDVTIRITAVRHQKLAPDSGVFTGRAEGDPLSHVVLSYVGSHAAGTIQHPAAGAYFEIRNGGDGQIHLTRLDPSRVPGCALCLDPVAAP